MNPHNQDLTLDTEAEKSKLDLSTYSYEESDTGNGERLVRKHGQNIRHIAESGEWMVWSTNGWEQDRNGTLMRMTKDVIDEIRAEAGAEFQEAYKTADGKVDEARLQEAKSTARFANSSARLGRRQAMIASAGFEQGIVTNSADWDADGWLLNCENGVINLRTQTFRERTQADLCTKRSPVVYDPEAKCPLWEEKLLQWMCGDKELVDYLQAAWGVSLTSDTSLQSLFFNQGGGANGKDTAFNTMSYVMGSYARSIDFGSVTFTENHSEHRNDLAVLAGAVRFLTTAESEQGRQLDEGKIKQFTGETPITCRHIHGKPFEYRAQFKLWMMSNYEPVIKGNDHGIWRRVRKIPWNYTVTAAETDPYLTDKLRAEAPGILNWALEGLRRFIELGHKLPACKAVDEATTQYRKEMDVIGRYCDECLVFAPSASILSSELYKSYQAWCKDNGYFALGSAKFRAELLRRHPEMQNTHTKRGALYIGVAVASEGTSEIVLQSRDPLADNYLPPEPDPDDQSLAAKLRRKQRDKLLAEALVHSSQTN